MSTAIDSICRVNDDDHDDAIIMARTGPMPLALGQLRHIIACLLGL